MHVIADIYITADTLTSRAGLSLFVRYLAGLSLLPLLDQLFGALRKSRKGQALPEIFKQVFILLVDGTSRHLAYFDALRKDEGYAAVVESGHDQLLSLHAVKRFFKAFFLPKIRLFSKLQRELFFWRP